MRFTCKDQGGTQYDVEADNPKEAAVQFCEELGFDPEHLPPTITVTVTGEDDNTEIVPVTTRLVVTFHAQ